MKLMLLGLTTTLTTLIGASSSRAEELKLKKDGEVATVDCGGKDIVLGGSRTTITLTGACAEVDVKGSESTIRIDRAAKIEIWGAKNSVEVVAADKFQIAGNDNKVSYVRALGKRKSPATKLWGKRNLVRRVANLSAAPPNDTTSIPESGATKPADPRATTGALKPGKPVMCQRNDNVTLEGVIIETEGVAITTQGNCSLTVRNSKIVSTKSAAVQTMGSSTVTFEDTEVIGKSGSIMNAGSAYVTIKRSTLRSTFAVEGSSTVKLENSHVHGPRNVGKSSTYIDGGGNTFHKK